MSLRTRNNLIKVTATIIGIIIGIAIALRIVPSIVG